MIVSFVAPFVQQVGQFSLLMVQSIGRACLMFTLPFLVNRIANYLPY